MGIGSNDLIPLTLGLDRDSELEQRAGGFDERGPAVRRLISRAIHACRHRQVHRTLRPGPSDQPDFAEWLSGEGITRISLNPDTVQDIWLLLA